MEDPLRDDEPGQRSRSPQVKGRSPRGADARLAQAPARAGEVDRQALRGPGRADLRAEGGAVLHQGGPVSVVREFFTGAAAMLAICLLAAVALALLAPSAHAQELVLGAGTESLFTQAWRLWSAAVSAVLASSWLSSAVVYVLVQL